MLASRDATGRGEPRACPFGSYDVPSDWKNSLWRKPASVRARVLVDSISETATYFAVNRLFRVAAKLSHSAIGLVPTRWEGFASLNRQTRDRVYGSEIPRANYRLNDEGRQGGLGLGTGRPKEGCCAEALHGGGEGDGGKARKRVQPRTRRCDQSAWVILAFCETLPLRQVPPGGVVTAGAVLPDPDRPYRMRPAS